MGDGKTGRRKTAAHKLPMADALILATARAHHAQLVSSDADFENIEGVAYLPKPRPG